MKGLIFTIIQSFVSAFLFAQKSNPSSVFLQDTLILKNNTAIICHVDEIHSDFVIYSVSKGTTTYKEKINVEKLNSVKFKNGTSQVFDNASTISNQNEKAQQLPKEEKQAESYKLPEKVGYYSIVPRKRVQRGKNYIFYTINGDSITATFSDKKRGQYVLYSSFNNTKLLEMWSVNLIRNYSDTLNKNKILISDKIFIRNEILYSSRNIGVLYSEKQDKELLALNKKAKNSKNVAKGCVIATAVPAAATVVSAIGIILSVVILSDNLFYESLKLIVPCAKATLGVGVVALPVGLILNNRSKKLTHRAVNIYNQKY